MSNTFILVLPNCKSRMLRTYWRGGTVCPFTHWQEIYSFLWLLLFDLSLCPHILNQYHLVNPELDLLITKYYSCWAFCSTFFLHTIHIIKCDTTHFLWQMLTLPSFIILIKMPLDCNIFSHMTFHFFITIF